MIRRLLWLLMLILVVLLPGRLEAKGPTWLVLLIDISDSVTADRYRIQKQAYVNALRDPVMIELFNEEQVHVAIVEFSNIPYLVSDFSTDYAALADLYEKAPRQREPHQPDQYDGRGPYQGGLTGVVIALTSALNMLEEKQGRRVIDISADNKDNISYMAFPQRDRAFRLVVEINVLLIKADLGKNDFLEVQAWYYDEVVTGFLITVEDFPDIEAALQRKFYLEIASN